MRAEPGGRGLEHQTEECGQEEAIAILICGDNMKKQSFREIAQQQDKETGGRQTNWGGSAIASLVMILLALEEEKKGEAKEDVERLGEAWESM